MMQYGHVTIHRFVSHVLKGNLPGDPCERKLAVYQPPGYDSDPHRRYPVIYLLSSFMGFGTMFLSPQAWGYSLDERCDVLISDGRMKPCLVVMPDCFTRWGGSQYLNSPALGRYRDYLVDELVPFVDSNYRTMAEPFHRAVGGRSSGGYGALRFVMDEASPFGACYASAADMYFEYCYQPDVPCCYDVLQRAGGLQPFVKSFFEAPKKNGDMITAMNILAMSAAYSPNPSVQPFGFDLPFDTETGALREDIWELWLRHDPVRILEQPESAARLHRLRCLLLECGKRDEYHLHIGARIFTQKLRQLGVRHEYEEFDDSHTGTGYRYQTALPKISRAIAEQA